MAVTGGCLREARKLQGEAFLVQVPQTLEVAVPGGDARCGPRTTFHVRISDTRGGRSRRPPSKSDHPTNNLPCARMSDTQVAVAGGVHASILVPRTCMLVSPFQTPQVTNPSCFLA
jgi:hypothetical protein